MRSQKGKEINNKTKNIQNFTFYQIVRNQKSKGKGGLENMENIHIFLYIYGIQITKRKQR